MKNQPKSQMNRILVIGCPGSGKSTFSKRLAKQLNHPLLHLDRIYHIDNNHQVSRDVFKEKIVQFIKENKTFIIDGNYSGTFAYRLQYADHVFYFDIPTKICLKNVIKRTKSKCPRTDMAPGFDDSIMDEDFIDYIKSFNRKIKPINDEILKNFNGSITKFNNYNQVEEFFKNL